jgi:hypothetical protein
MKRGGGFHDYFSASPHGSRVQLLGGEKLSSSFSRFRAAAAFNVV